MNEIIISQIRQRLEILYQMVDELEKSGGGGGEPGTTNYNDLTNKPSVNGHILIGSKTSSDLDLQPVISDLSTIRSGAAAGATAVQPATMNQALDDKQDKLTFDSTPTSGSTNPVTSGGVYTSLTTKVNKVDGKGLSTNDFTNADKAQISANKAGIGAVANAGSKNIVNNTAAASTENAGITWTKNVDGSMTGTGTCTGTSGVRVVGTSGTHNYASAIPIPQGTYVVAPTNSPRDNERFILYMWTNSSATPTTTIIQRTAYTFTVDNDTTRYDFSVGFAGSGVTMDMTLYPMICPKVLYDIDDTYVPYAPTNRELYEMILALQ